MFCKCCIDIQLKWSQAAEINVRLLVYPFFVAIKVAYRTPTNYAKLFEHCS